MVVKKQKQPRKRVTRANTTTRTSNARKKGTPNASKKFVRSFVAVLLIGLGIFLQWQWNNFFNEHSKMIPDEGGVLSESIVGTVTNLSPLAPYPTPADKSLHALLFEGLLKYNPVTGQIENALADFQIGDEGTSYYLTLKDTAKFSDGSQVTIDDVLFTYKKVIQNPLFGNEILREAFQYTEIEVTDTNTLKFTLPARYIFFPSLLTVPIIPAKPFKDIRIIEEITDPDHPYNKKPIGAGPYRLRNVIPSDDQSLRIFLEANPHYYAGEAHIPKMVITVYPTFDHLSINQNWQTLYSFVPTQSADRFEKKLLGEYKKQNYVLPQWAGVFFNLDSPIAQNLNIRTALAFSANKDTILEDGWNRIDSFFFFEGIADWYAFDANKARGTLQAGGFPLDTENENRTIGRDGENAKLTFITTNAPSVYSRMAQKMTTTWEKELKLDIDLQILNEDEFQTALRERNYDMVLYGQNFGENLDNLSTWHSAEAGKLNLANLTNEKIDLLIHEIQIAGAQSDFFELSGRLNDIIPGIPLVTPQYTIFRSKDLFGFDETFKKVRNHAQRYFGVHTWYFEQKQDWDWPEEKSKLWGFLQWLVESKSDFDPEAPLDESIEQDLPPSITPDETETPETPETPA